MNKQVRHCPGICAFTPYSGGKWRPLPVTMGQAAARAKPKKGGVIWVGEL